MKAFNSSYLNLKKFLSKLWGNRTLRISIKAFGVFEFLIFILWIVNIGFCCILVPWSFHNNVWTVIMQTTTFKAMIIAGMPILVTAVGATFNERSGNINIGLEGIMLVGAFAGIYGSYATGNPWIGVLFAVVMGIFTALIHAVMTVTYQAEQIVVGVAINLLALGVTKVFAELVWGGSISSSGIKAVPKINIFEIPILGFIFEILSFSQYSDVPFIGGIFAFLPDIILALNNLSAIMYIAILLIPICHVLLFKTPFGLRTRVIGELPEAAATAGLSVHKYQYLALMISGGMAGFGGALLTLGNVPVFQSGLVGGRGFIALAAMIFGKWTVIGSVFASIFFGYFFAFRIKFGTNVSGFNVPQPFIQMIPYIITMVVLAQFVGKAEPPQNIGKPYSPED